MVHYAMSQAIVTRLAMDRKSVRIPIDPFERLLLKAAQLPALPILIPRAVHTPLQRVTHHIPYGSLKSQKTAALPVLQASRGKIVNCITCTKAAAHVLYS